jgi:hypothetical protein
MADKKSLFAQNIGESRMLAKVEIQEKLDKDSYADFMSAMKDRAISVKAILQGLEACGVKLSAGPIQKWREELSNNGEL